MKPAMPSRIRPLTISIGLVVTIIGGVTLFGLMRRSVLLSQIRPAYPPAQFNAVICLTLLGVGLTLIGWHVRTRSLAAAVAAGGAGLLATAVFLQYLFGIDLQVDALFFEPWASQYTPVPGRMAPNVALSVLMLGAAMLLLSRGKFPFASAVLGAVAFTLAGAVLIGYLAGAPELFAWRDQNPMALVSSVCLVFLGAGVVIAANDRLPAAHPGRTWWGPLLAGVAISAAGLVLWNALRLDHSRRLQAAVEADAAAVRSEFASTMRAPLDRFRLVAAQTTIPLTSLLSEEIAGVANIEWYPAAEVPAAGAIASQTSGGEIGEDLMATALAYANERRSAAIVGPLVDAGGSADIRIVVPVIRNGELRGFLSGTLPVIVLAETALVAASDRQLSLEVMCGVRSVYRSQAVPSPALWSETVDLPLPGPLPWTVVVAPAAGYVPAEGAELPEVILGVILFTALLLALSAQMGQSQTVRADRLAAAVRARSRELRQSLRGLRRANVAKDNFIGMLGHELRNPLGAILSATELLRREGQEKDRAIEVIDKEGAHLSRILDDLLDIARIEHGQLVVEVEPVDLAALVHDATDSSRLLIEAKDLVLEQRLPARPVWIRADATRIRQVIGNLLANAVKFSKPGGRIGVQVAADEVAGTATVNITDYGQGIDPETLDQIFEPFVQARTDPGEERIGLGLGLSIVRGLVEAHGGQIRALSQGVDRGAELVVNLPLGVAPQDAGGAFGADSGDASATLANVLERTSPQSPAPMIRTSEPTAAPDTTVVEGVAGSRSGLVLLIEDHGGAADMMSRLISRFGYRVEVALNGADGIGAVERALPDLVLCDLGLPGMTGYEVVGRLREIPGMSKVPIIAISGYGRPQDVERARQAGFNTHMLKPINPAALQAILDRHLASASS